MEVTAVIADDLINEVKAYTRSSTITEAISIALKDWVDMYNIKELNKKIAQKPVCISEELVKSNTRKEILKYMDSGIWEGNLAEMRAMR